VEASLRTLIVILVVGSVLGNSTTYHSITPVGAFALIVAEDVLDRYLVLRAERRVKNPVVRLLLRVVLNPGRTAANTARGRALWARDGRALTWR